MNSQDLDFTANSELLPPDKISLRPAPNRRTNFSTAFKEQVFYIWYNEGKPQERKLILLIPEDLEEHGRMPAVNCLKDWIDKDFVPRARILDEEVKEQMDVAVVSERIKMMQRHAKVGLEMQDIAIKGIRENADILNAGALVRLLVEGVRIERESRGISTTLEKIMHMSDEQLTDEVNRIVTRGKLTESTDADSE